MKPVQPLLLPPTPPPRSGGRAWLWIGGTLVLAAAGAAMVASRSPASSSGSGTPSGTPAGSGNDKPPDLQGWPVTVAAGATGAPAGLHFFRAMPPNPMGPIVWVLYGSEEDPGPPPVLLAQRDPRALAPWIPTTLADVVFVERVSRLPDAKHPQGPAAQAQQLIDLAVQGTAIPGPFIAGKKSRPWVVVGNDASGAVALHMMRASPNQSPSAAVLSAPDLLHALPADVAGDKRWLAFLVGDKDPAAAKVTAAVEALGKQGFNAVERVVAGVGRELPALGPQLRDLLLDVFTMFPFPP